MNLRFETCNRHTAHGFLEKFYPSCTVDKDHPSVSAVFDLVELEVFRIPDPMMHPGGQVVPGKNWDADKATETIAILQAMHDHIMSTDKSDGNGATP